LRVPAHPVALELLRAARIPLAAPSANRSETVSPTAAEHVLRTLDGRIDAVLDAGPCPGGVESTVVDCTATPPRILRPGLLTAATLREAAPDIETSDPTTHSFARSPGSHGRHYAPHAPLFVAEDAARSVRQHLQAGRTVGWIRCGPSARSDEPRLHAIELPGDPIGYARELYAALHELDRAGVDLIVVDRPPADEDWLAIRDRLRRAAHRAMK
jgi:L-threonylcarbamoyladenylate synthase